MSRAAVIAAMPFDDSCFKPERFDCIVAVDGGYEALRRHGVTPTVAVGDFDSLGYIPNDCPIRQFPEQKDDSDLALGLQWVMDEGYTDITVFGAISGRLDHTQAAIAACVHAARAGAHVLSVGPHSALAVLDEADARVLGFKAFDPASLPAEDGTGTCGNVISVLAFGGTAHGVCERGLAYGLQDASLPDDVSRGLSNEFIGEAVRIALGKGTLLVMFSSAALPYLDADTV